MAGWDDPRYAQQQFNRLAKRIHDLEKSTIKVGPTGGSIQRLLTSGGNPLMDWQGFIATLTILLNASTSAGGTHNAGGSTAVQNIYAQTFTVQSRPQNVLVIATLAGGEDQQNGTFTFFGGNVYHQITGQSASAICQTGQYNTSSSASQTVESTATMTQVLTALPAGTYTTNIVWKPLQTTSVLNWWSKAILVFQLGS